MAKFGIGARVVDLLGRQQVAGAPTAVNEIFKNAHDAYADEAVVDFLRSRGLLVLRDDGVGMSRKDFETRWLVAATDSKRAGAFVPPPPTDPEKKPRPVMGEKGIGRLAIAVLGPQVLVLTRAKTAERDGALVAAFVNWSVFELPGLVIDDVHIPVETYSGPGLPDADYVRSMTKQTLDSLQRVRSRTDTAMLQQVIEEVNAFRVDPSALARTLASGPALLGDRNWGTHFYIHPVAEAVAADVDPDKGPGAERRPSTPMQQVLLGFSNTMKSTVAQLEAERADRSGNAPMRVAFRDHRPGAEVVDVIAENRFWTADDFQTADHHIEGRFDARGQFEGTIRIYDGDPVDLVVPWLGSNGRDTRCGPFDLRVGYYQGAERESLSKGTDFAEATGKLLKIGGLYIYRDDIRILPYGNEGYDFLGFEERRSRSASYYFFSYRRMFGHVDTTRSDNAALVEKAGREGFQENVAYKQFKQILQEFFVQVAAEFFRQDGAHSEAFRRTSARLEEEDKLLEKRRRQIVPRRRQLKSDLDAFFRRIETGSLRLEATGIVERLCSALAGRTENDLDAVELMALETQARSELRDLERQTKVVRPRGVGLPRELSRLWSSYQVEAVRVDAEIFGPIGPAIAAAVAEIEERLSLRVDRRRKALERLDVTARDERRSVSGLRREVGRQADELASEVRRTASASFAELDAGIRSAMVEFEREGHDHLPDSELNALRDDLERRITNLAERQSEHLGRLRDDLRSLLDREASDGSADLLSAMETRLEEAQEREAENMRLAQMGQAVGIVHHEFSAVIAAVRRNLRKLGSWADKNPQLQPVYDEIRDSYRHLDSYLGLFAPLNRNLSSTDRAISGREIEAYLRQLFDERLRRHEIELVASDAFQTAIVVENVANLYPAFVNLVDNAIFWVSRPNTIRPSGEDVLTKRRIELAFEEGAFVVRDEGPGIAPSDGNAVFESGFSRKPGGSGLGLHITRNLLSRNGYELDIDPWREGEGATFRIRVPHSKLQDDVST